LCKASDALQQAQSYFFSLKTRPAPLAEICSKYSGSARLRMSICTSCDL
jgi:hypothetical protein